MLPPPGGGPVRAASREGPRGAALCLPELPPEGAVHAVGLPGAVSVPQLRGGSRSAVGFAGGRGVSLLPPAQGAVQKRPPGLG